jgi:hypothetical protein
MARFAAPENIDTTVTPCPVPSPLPSRKRARGILGCLPRILGLTRVKQAPTHGHYSEVRAGMHPRGALVRLRANGTRRAQPDDGPGTLAADSTTSKVRSSLGVPYDSAMDRAMPSSRKSAGSAAARSM